MAVSKYMFCWNGLKQDFLSFILFFHFQAKVYYKAKRNLFVVWCLVGLHFVLSLFWNYEEKNVDWQLLGATKHKASKRSQHFHAKVTNRVDDLQGMVLEL
jgi:hypothetical protein